jgi:hypothetical protein
LAVDAFPDSARIYLHYNIKGNDIQRDIMHFICWSRTLMTERVDVMTGCISSQTDPHHAVTYQRRFAFPMHEFDVIVFLSTVVNFDASERLSKLVTKAREGSRLFARVDRASIAASSFK